MVAIGWILGIGMLAVALFLVFTPWVQTTVGFGTVTALDPNDRVQEVNALVSGRVQEWFVRDGSPVAVGDPIVRIVDNDPQLLERLDAERSQVIAKLEAAESAVSTAAIDRDRMYDLFEKGLAARREYEQARIRVDELRARVAEASAELARMEVNLTRQSIQVVRAPRDGIILRVNAADTATLVNAGDVVASFVPNDVDRAVEIYVDGRDVALVSPGDPVRLQFEGWPVVQFSGWPSLAIGVFHGTVTAVDPSAQANGRFRVLVTEDASEGISWPDDRYVRFGSNARGWILLDTVSVGFEIWRRLNDFPPNLPGFTSGTPPQ